MNRFLEDLAQHPDRVGRKDWAEQRWPSFASWVDRGVVQVHVAREFDLWPCEAPATTDCMRELVVEEGDWTAVCACDSQFAGEPERIDPQRFVIREARWVEWLATAAGVTTPGPVRELTPLGERRSGADSVLVLWARHTRVERELALLLEDHRPRAAVVLLAHRRQLQTLVPARLRGIPVVWLALSEVLHEPTLRVDLAEVRERHGVGGLDLLWPRFALALDDRYALWHGTQHDLGRTPAQLALLAELGTQAGVFVPRSELLPALFPDEFTNRGRCRTDPLKLDRRLRQLVSRVNAGMGEGPEGRLPIENLRARADTDGGYRIALPPYAFIDLRGEIS